tara:strand:+ start:868 stop:1542 length:675 start_codon:yes stop_codon:yes gene_type:complete
MRTAILIPARLESKRYPNKPLVELNGIPMIKRIFDICNQTDYDTYVVTDSEEIASQVPNYVMTGKASNGTERCAMAAKQLDYGNFVNVQGDMPDVTPKMINSVVEYLKYYPIATLFADMPKIQQDEPSTVKMVRAGDKALWFGRGMTGYGDWHLGIYAYRNDALNLYPSLEITQEEKVEKLEQLRWLKAGWEIGCTRVDFDGIEINTKEDLKKWVSKNERTQNN